MPQRIQANQNRLLSSLPRADRKLVEPHLKFSEFALDDVFEERDVPITSLCFIESGFASVVATGIEVGLIGREGITGIAVILGGDRSPNVTYAQHAGSGHRIEARAMRKLIGESDALRALLLNYVHTFMIQTTQAVLSNARAQIGERLARWILMGHDRTDAAELPLTHKYLSLMLGVRRASVTGALKSLHEHGLIRSRRGWISILDRAGLQKIAGPSYGVPEAEYRRLIG